MGSGGGGAGATTTPDYIQKYHEILLAGSTSGTIGGAVSNLSISNHFTRTLNTVLSSPNPYEAQTEAYDPTDVLEESFGNIQIGSETDLRTQIIEDLEDTQTYVGLRYATLKDRFLAKKHATSRALMARFSKSGLDYSSLGIRGEATIQLRLEAEDAAFKTSVIESLVKERLSNKALAVQIAAQYSAVKISAFKDYAGDVFNIQEKAMLWDLQVYQYAGNFMGAFGGTQGLVKPELTKTQSALAGAANGLAAGMMTGNTYGAIGGTVLGGFLGYQQGN